MMKAIFSRALSKRKAAVLAAMALGILVLAAGTAAAITYTTSTRPALKLNKTSYVGTALTGLVSNFAGPALTLGTHSTDPNATPLSLDTKTGDQAPMKVDSEQKVTNLNADKLDGKDSGEFYTGATYLIREADYSGGVANGEDGKLLFCDSGDKLLSGGYDFPGGATGFLVTVAQPGGPAGPAGGDVYVFLWKSGDTAVPVKISATCLDLGEPHETSTEAASGIQSANEDSRFAEELKGR